ncbi:MAG: hypothetical protein ACOX9B_06655 [Candidatus Xenobium sp.]|jgi:hypothetical protein|nr:hypothetical protein [Burkholderiales bacterium]
MDPLSKASIVSRSPGPSRATSAPPAPSASPEPQDTVEVRVGHVPRRRILGDWLRQTARGGMEVAAYMIGSGLGEVLVRLDELNRKGEGKAKTPAAAPSERMAPVATRLSEGAILGKTTVQSARAAARDLISPPPTFAARARLLDQPRSTLDIPQARLPVQSLDQTFCERIEGSGWQGQSLLVSGEVEDCALLAWVEHGEKGLSLHLRGYLTEEGDRRMQAWISAQPEVSSRHSELETPRLHMDRGLLREGEETLYFPVGQHFELQDAGGFGLRYSPRVPGYVPSDARGTSPPASVQGMVELQLPLDEVDPEGVQRLLEPLRASGVVEGMATSQDLELAYLQRMSRALGVETRVLQADGAAAKGERILQARQDLSAALGIPDVARLPDYDWKPRFDELFVDGPRPGQTGGWPRWNRFDASVYLDQELRDWRLTHHVYGNQGAKVAEMIRTTGGLQCTEERLGRLGSGALGISSMKDRRSGGARYVFTHLENRPDKATLVFNQDLLLRSDQIGFRPGRFGRVYDGREALRTPLEAYHRTPIYEVMLQNSVSFLDYLEQVNLPSREDRVQVLEAFREVGIQEIRGVPVEELVRVIED